MKHTAFPWKILKIMPAEPDSDFEIYTGTEDAPQKSIATVNGLNMLPGEAEANAALIVRACVAHEELVAILKPFIEIWHKGGRDYQEKIRQYWQYDELHKALAALAKAEAL